MLCSCKNNRRHNSCIKSHLENESVFLTKRPSLWRKMLLKRSGLYWGDVTRLAVPFACGFVLFIRQHLVVGVPEVAIKQRLFVAFGNTLPPSRSASAAASGTSARCDHQSQRRRSGGFCGIGPTRPSACFCAEIRTTTSRMHRSALLRIEFQNVRLLGFCQRLLQERQVRGFFTPGDQGLATDVCLRHYCVSKMRHTPRREARS